MNHESNNFSGREVSCRTFERLLREWKKTGHPLSTLVKGVDCSLSQLQNKHERISWANYRGILSNSRAVWDDDDYYRLGLIVMDTPWARPFTIPARLLYSAKDFFHMMIRPGGGIARQMFSCVNFEKHEVEPGRLLIEMTMQEGYPICHEYFLITRGTLTVLPNLSGLGNAEVEMGEIPGGVQYYVRLPEGGGILSGVRRFVTTPFTARAAARELEEAYAVLHARNIALGKEISQRQRIEDQRERLIKDLEVKNVELEQKNAEMERFVYTVSHDLKSPLVTIKGFLGLLERDAERGNTEGVQKAYAQIHRAADRMGRLLNELLELSRVGLVIHELEDANVNELVEEALELIAGLIDPSDVRVTAAKGMPCVRVDRVRILEVFQNLIENALKFMGDQPVPRVDIGAQQHGDEVHCFVKDNGIGILPKYHDKVFQVFERLNQDVEGTGIGLALVKRIITMHGGRIWIESEGADEGTTVWFSIPAADTP